MNRQIKFRAWSKATKKMVDWDYIHSIKNLHKLMTLNHIVLMQFTGLHDKNGKEIYEGDIIKHDLGIEEHTSKHWHIVFEFGSFQMRNEIYKLPLSFVHHAYLSLKKLRITEPNEYESHLEIIGNIHESTPQQ